MSPKPQPAPYPGVMISAAAGGLFITHVLSILLVTLIGVALVVVNPALKFLIFLLIGFFLVLPIGCTIWIIIMLTANLKRLPASNVLASYPERLSATRLFLTAAYLYVFSAVLSIIDVNSYLQIPNIDRLLDATGSIIELVGIIMTIIGISRYTTPAKHSARQR